MWNKLFVFLINNWKYSGNINTYPKNDFIFLQYFHLMIYYLPMLSQFRDSEIKLTCKLKIKCFWNRFEIIMFLEDHCFRSFFFFNTIFCNWLYIVSRASDLWDLLPMQKGKGSRAWYLQSHIKSVKKQAWTKPFVNETK